MPGGVAVFAFWDLCRVFFFAGAGLFSPRLFQCFFVRDKGGGKRAAYNLGKIAPCSEAERRNFDLSFFLIGRSPAAAGGSFLMT
jgi:hypothetical protein